MPRSRKRYIEMSIAGAVLALVFLVAYPRFQAVQLGTQIQARQDELQYIVDRLLAYDMDKVPIDGVVDSDAGASSSGLLPSWGGSGGHLDFDTAFGCAGQLSPVWRERLDLPPAVYPTTFVRVDFKKTDWRRGSERVLER